MGLPVQALQNGVLGQVELIQEDDVALPHGGDEGPVHPREGRSRGTGPGLHLLHGFPKPLQLLCTCRTTPRDTPGSRHVGRSSRLHPCVPGCCCHQSVRACLPPFKCRQAGLPPSARACANASEEVK